MKERAIVIFEFDEEKKQRGKKGGKEDDGRDGRWRGALRLCFSISD